ncbi:MAG TPA: alpha/beta fold hydrolase [Flavobacteriales bacterium]
MASPLPIITSGSGTPLLLIHGFPHDHTLWTPQLRDLAGDAWVIAPDLRGSGGAKDPAPVQTMALHVQDLIGVLDHLGVEQAVICGLSMGGYIALALLKAHPNRVKGLILCNTRAGADDDKAKEGREATAKKALTEGVAVIADEMIGKMVAPNASPTLRTTVRDLMARQSPSGVAASARGMASREDQREFLPTITVPTLIITGSADTLIPPSESEAMHRAIPNSKLVVIPEVAHLSNQEAPVDFNREVSAFLKAL